MTIDKQYDKFVVTCDGCGEDYEPQADEFGEVVEEIKANGWTIRKTPSGWEHYCEQCDP